jgi:hypothetical protein
MPWGIAIKIIENQPRFIIQSTLATQKDGTTFNRKPVA